MRVLVAEDEPALATLLRELLEGNGVEVTVSDDPVETRRWVEIMQGKLVLDGSVLEKTGLLLKELPDTTVIFSGDSELVEKARERGLRAYLKGDWDSTTAMVRAIRDQDAVASRADSPSRPR